MGQLTLSTSPSSSSVSNCPGKWSLHFGANKISLQDARTAPDIAWDTVPGSGNFCVLTDEPVEREGATGKILSVYFPDPDGNLVEVSNRL